MLHIIDTAEAVEAAAAARALPQVMISELAPMGLAAMHDVPVLADSCQMDGCKCAERQRMGAPHSLAQVLPACHRSPARQSRCLCSIELNQTNRCSWQTGRAFHSETNNILGR